MIVIRSFGFKHRGKSPDSKLYDCRDLPNPYRNPYMRTMTGLDLEVKNWVLQSEGAHKLLDLAVKNTKDNAVLEFACVGGRHRSVVMAECAAEAFRNKGFEVHVSHTEL